MTLRHAGMDSTFTRGFEGMDLEGSAIYSMPSSAELLQVPGRGHNRADQRAHWRSAFEEAVFGVEKTLKVNRVENCSVCHGQVLSRRE